MARINPIRFIKEVRSEVGKIVWPTRRESIVTTIMVFIMAAVAAGFFFLVDQLVRLALNAIGIGV